MMCIKYVIFTFQNVTMIVDQCQTARNRDVDPPVTDRSMCQGTAFIEPFNEFLNVNGPLQLGGVKHSILTSYDWKFAHTRKGFSGCIKNVIHNSQVSFTEQFLIANYFSYAEYDMLLKQVINHHRG